MSNDLLRVHPVLLVLTLALAGALCASPSHAQTSGGGAPQHQLERSSDTGETRPDLR